MHLLVPFAFACSPGARAALAGLNLPHLSQLLGQLQTEHVDAGDELSLSPPHERALAQARGWGQLPDGLLPLAAHAAQTQGLAVGAQQGWAFVCPSHWHLGTEQISLADPQSLGLEAAESQAFFAAVAPLFADDGWALHHTPQAWLASHALLAQLPTASLDRVIGRNVDRWLEAAASARQALRAVRRLQAEAQMLLHSHPLNAEREARGLLPVNSLWLSGTGAGVATTSSATDIVVDERLRSAALNERWDEWASAWQALDAGPLRQLCDLLAQNASPSAPPGAPAIRLTLCGERQAHRYAAPASRPWWRKGWLAPRAPSPLQALELL